MNSRRQFLLGSASLALAGWLPLRLAAASTQKRLLVVVLRGAMDSLGALVPYADPRYRSLRGSLALAEDERSLLRLDSTFALHGALAPLLPLWQNGELLLLPASASNYRERSHFDGQNVLESGASQPHLLTSGWLNRSLNELPGASALAIGPSLPLLLQGPAQVGAWSPSSLPAVNSDFLHRVEQMYASDPQLAPSLAAAVGMSGASDMDSQQGQQAVLKLFAQSALFLRSTARIASLDINGWDTHSNQGSEQGRLARQLQLLASGLSQFRQTMAADWADTAVLVVTEFGRTVRVNGSGGTDHGTASLAMLLGGAVRGGRWLGDWPTLARLYEDRDLYPANDLRSLLKGTLHEHLGISHAALEQRVFPASEQAAAYTGLFA
jgi:uncharacterized protein (DUF1501 family)